MGHVQPLRRPAILAATALAVPGLAAAQTPPAPPTTASVALNATCFTPGDPMIETASGFTPGAPVSLTVSLLDPASTPLASLSGPVVSANADGTFTRTLRTPNLARDGDRREIARSAYAEQVPGGKSASAQWTLSGWYVDVPQWNTSAIAVAKPGRKITVDAYGWTNLGPSLFIHYFRGSTHVKTFKLGALTGDCKDLRTRVRQFPFKNVKPGSWTVYFSTTAVFDKRHDAFGRYRVRVPKK
jgi:hypothetical protein